MKPSPSTPLQIYRVQASDGRGPWRPGLSHHWVEDNSEERLLRHPSVLSEFGTQWLSEIPEGWHSGCACRSIDALLAWFTPLEMQRLESMGYEPVSLEAERIIRESKDQLVFTRRLPLNSGALLLPWRIAA